MAEYEKSYQTIVYDDAGNEQDRLILTDEEADSLYNELPQGWYLETYREN